MTTSDPILFDSNVLIYNHNISAPLYQQSRNYHEKVLAGEISGIISPQNLTEFLAVVTSYRRMTQPLSGDKALTAIKNYLNPASNFTVIYPNQLTLQIFQDLEKKYKVSSQKIFDVFLVATMLGNNISTLLTANTKDFALFPQIKIIDLSTKR